MGVKHVFGKFIRPAVIVLCAILVFAVCAACTAGGDSSTYDESIPPEGSAAVQSSGEESGDTSASDPDESYPENIGATESAGEQYGTSTGSAAVNATAIPSASAENSGTTAAATSAEQSKPPVNVEIEGELRGVWVSYIEIDSMLKGKNAQQAKSGIDTIMDNVVSYGLNTVMFHARSNSNAYYVSAPFKPAASAAGLLSGGFDPLEYAVEAAHSRGLALHAWINPYRIGTDKSYNMLDEKDMFTAPNANGTTIYYYIPTSMSAQTLIIDGVSEIVKNYNVDGVQFDDYFYPDVKTIIPREAPADFETESYGKYTGEGGKLGIADWRRVNVNALVANVYSRVKTDSKNRKAVFGISPSYNVATNYSGFYADVTLWMTSKGYLDYIAPQIYFGFEHRTAPFAPKADEWAAFPRDSSVTLYVGLPMYKSGITDGGSDEWKLNDNIVRRQVEYVRKKSGISGFMVYTYSSFALFPKEAENLKAVLT